jgi:hypothetical protein
VWAVQVHNSEQFADLPLSVLSAGMTITPPIRESGYDFTIEAIYPHANFKSAMVESHYICFEQQARNDRKRGSLAMTYHRALSGWLLSLALLCKRLASGGQYLADVTSYRWRGVTFSIDAGFYSQPQTLILTSNQSNAAIHYTLNGNEPTDSSPLYTAPLQISQTTVVRARCTGSGITAGPIATNTYIIGRQPNLAVISLTTAPANLWDPDSGIYVLGPNASSELPYYGANFWQDWEKPVHVEFFEPDGVQGFELEAGLQIFGGWSRACAQKPLAIFARGKYGTSEINYRIFRIWR